MKLEDRNALARYRFEKALRTLSVARDNLGLGHFEVSVGRSYYAIFSGMRSLLALKGVDSRKHSGVIALFNKHFLNENLLPKESYKLIMKAKILREAADYADFTQIPREMAEEYLTNAEVFLRRVEEVLRKLMIERNGK